MKNKTTKPKVVRRRPAQDPNVRVIDENTTKDDFDLFVKEYTARMLEVAEKHHGPAAFDDLDMPEEP